MKKDFLEDEQKYLKVIEFNRNISEELDKKYDSMLNPYNKLLNDSQEITEKYHTRIKQKEDNQYLEQISIPPASYTILKWDDLVKQAEENINYEVTWNDILSEEDIQKIKNNYSCLYESFNSIHRLDGLDWTIAGIAGILASIVDVFLVQMPQHKGLGLLGTKDNNGGILSNWFSNHIQESLTPDEISKLERDNWVPYDAANNKNLNINIDGLNSRTHRIQSLGHDPLLSFIFGVKDILNGEFTAIDIKGTIITQSIDMSNHPEMLGMSLFNAIGTVIGHLKSDIATPSGLPAPLMSLLQLIPGNIKGHTFTEIIRTMYTQGYNFNHFLSMSVPVMIIEVLVRILYFSKRHWKDGYSINDSIPFGDRPKLQTILFSAHSIATAANAGKIYLQANPLAINYTQWVTFFKYSYGQIKWTLVDKPNNRFHYIQNEINYDWTKIDEDITSIFKEINTKPYNLL